MEFGILFELKGKRTGIRRSFVAIHQVIFQRIAAHDEERIVEADQGVVDRVVFPDGWVDVVNRLAGGVADDPGAGRGSTLRQQQPHNLHRHLPKPGAKFRAGKVIAVHNDRHMVIGG